MTSDVALLLVQLQVTVGRWSRGGAMSDPTKALKTASIPLMLKHLMLRPIMQALNISHRGREANSRVQSDLYVKSN